MSSRVRSAPSYLSAYAGHSSGDEFEQAARWSEEDAGEGSTRKKSTRGGGRGRGSRGGRGGRGGRPKSMAAATVARRQRRANAAAKSGEATGAEELEEGEEYEEEQAAAVAAPVSATRSARLQGQKRKTYEEPGEDDFDGESGDEEAQGQQQQSAAQESTSKRARVRSQAPKAKPSRYLDLNGCLGKSNLDRILARKRMPAPATHFLANFIAQLPPQQQALLHPDDMERFAPELYQQHHARIKQQEAEAMEEQRRKQLQSQPDSADDSGLGLDAAMPDSLDSGGLSLDAAPTSVALAPETTSVGSFRVALTPTGSDEWWYLIKWKDHSYTPLSLQWMPHSLLSMFDDTAARLRRFETTRSNGEISRSHARQSKSDEELEEDEQRTVELARALRARTLDERTIRAQVAMQEEKIREQQDALRAPASSTLAALLDDSNTGSSSSSSSAAAGAVSSHTPALTPAQVREVESRLEALRISRRLADLHNDHKLGRMKRIRSGFFDADYLVVERIIAHRRRGKTAGKRTFKRFFGPSQPQHWSYYGLTPAAVHALQRSVASYVSEVNTATKRFMYELAEAIDPRVRMQRDAWEELLQNKIASPAATASATDDAPQSERKHDEEEADEEMKSSDNRAAQAVTEKSSIKPEPAVELTAWMDDGDDEKDQSTSTAAAAAAALPPAPPSPSPAASSTPPRSAGHSRGTPPTAVDASPSPTAVNSSVPSDPSAHSSGRPRRAAAGRRLRELEAEQERAEGGEGDAFVPSDDDTDLQRVLKASQRESSRRPRQSSAAAAAAVASAIDFDEAQYGDGLVAEEPAMEVVSEDDGIVDSEDPNISEEFEFLVKWLQLPYEHCTWETRADLRRLDEMRAMAQVNSKIEGLSSELNPAVPVPLLALLPFVPLSSLLFSNNLLLKHAELPIVVSDEQHAAILPHASQPNAHTALHPTIPLSLVQASNPAVTASAGSATAVRSSCITALHNYLRTHATKSRHAAIVYPPTKGCAGAADVAAARNNVADKQAPASFTMRSAAVDSSDRFGRTGQLSLRDYQLHGVNFMALNWSIGRNSILADEMGLGKTVQASILLNWMVTRQHVTQPILIVAPLSTLGFWSREIDRWTDLHGVIYRGSPESRKVIREWEWNWPSSAAMSELDAMRREEGVSIDDLTPAQRLVSPVTATTPERRSHKFNILLTSYEFIINDFAVFSKIKFSALVIDEAQRLKNSSSKLFERLQQMKIARRLLLTGTPIQNDLKELFALLHFIDPIQFHSESEFLDHCGSMNTLAQVTKLFHFLRPVVLRRLKSDVEKNLPNKDEILIEIQLTNMQKKYYRAIYEKNFKLLTNAAASSSAAANAGSGAAAASSAQGGATRLAAGLRNISMQLRKVCNHPYLIDHVEREELESLQSKLPYPQVLSADQVMESLVSASGKFLLLDKLLPKLKHEGHRVLIFSQMTRVLDILSDYLNYRRYKFERLDGNVPTAERQFAIDKFSEPNSEIFAFLLSTRAGGLGLTLTAADTVILFDSDWNLLNDKQAMDRAHRIGQQKEVTIFRLITQSTYEMEMFKRACLKLSLDHIIMASLNQSVEGGSVLPIGLDTTKGKKKKHALIGSNPLDASFNEMDEANAATPGAAAAGTVPFDRAEVEEMLKHGAYGVFSADAQSDLQSIRFAEEDIDHILRRSKVVKYGDEEEEEKKGGEGEGAVGGVIKVEVVSKSEGSAAAASAAPTSSNKSGSTFSKASFIPKGGGEELSMSDPLFWSKLGMQDKSAPEPTMTDAAEVLETKRVRKPVQTFNLNNDDDDGSASQTSGGYEERERGPKGGPAICPICEEVVRISAANPVLECARCEDQSHLSCLGLGAIPAEDEWFCPACVREMKSTKGRPRMQAKDEEEDEEEYRPNPQQMLAWKRAANEANRNYVASSTTANGHSSRRSSASFKRFAKGLSSGAASFTSSSNPVSIGAAQRAQYMRLIGTFRITQPGKSDAEYRRMADTLWSQVFKSEPPTGAPGSSSPPQLQQQRGLAAPYGTKSIVSQHLLLPQLPPQSSHDVGSMPLSHFSQHYRQQPPSQPVGFMQPPHAHYSPHTPSVPAAAPPLQAAAAARPSTASAAPAADIVVPPGRIKCSAQACPKLDGEPGVPAFLLCGKCRGVRYCSRVCQSADWKARHKAKCDPASAPAKPAAATSMSLQA